MSFEQAIKELLHNIKKDGKNIYMMDITFLTSSKKQYNKSEASSIEDHFQNIVIYDRQYYSN